jgi:hypothetical protein
MTPDTQRHYRRALASGALGGFALGYLCHLALTLFR